MDIEAPPKAVRASDSQSKVQKKTKAQQDADMEDVGKEREETCYCRPSSQLQPGGLKRRALLYSPDPSAKVASLRKLLELVLQEEDVVARRKPLSAVCEWPHYP